MLTSFFMGLLKVLAVTTVTYTSMFPQLKLW